MAAEKSQREHRKLAVLATRKLVMPSADLRFTCTWMGAKHSPHPLSAITSRSLFNVNATTDFHNSQMHATGHDHFRGWCSETFTEPIPMSFGRKTCDAECRPAVHLHTDGCEALSASPRAEGTVRQ